MKGTQVPGAALIALHRGKVVCRASKIARRTARQIGAQLAQVRTIDRVCIVEELQRPGQRPPCPATSGTAI